MYNVLYRLKRAGRDTPVVNDQPAPQYDDSVAVIEHRDDLPDQTALIQESDGAASQLRDVTCHTHSVTSLVTECVWQVTSRSSEVCT